MNTIFIADKEVIKKDFPELTEIQEFDMFKDSLVVYSCKIPIENFDELKQVVNSYRQTWENTLYQDTETYIEDYDAIMNEFIHLGSVRNLSGEICISTDKTTTPPLKYQGLSAFIKDFEGEFIVWNDNIVGDPHILGIGKDGKNFFTVNNYA